MAADFNKPVLTDDYISILEQLRQNYDVLARMFSTGTTANNIPVGSVRFDSGKFQTWSGSAWVDVPLSLDGGGTGAQSAADARVALGANNAANLTEGILDAARVPGLDASKIVSGTMTQDTSGNAATATYAASAGNAATATYAASAGNASAAPWAGITGKPNVVTNSNSTVVGDQAFDNNTIGIENTAVGFRACYQNTTGGRNTAVGFHALYQNTTGSYNTAVGWSALYANTSYNNCSGLGRFAAVTGSNQVQLGNSDTTTYVYGTVQNRSDERDKSDIRDTELGLEFIKKLRPVDYRWDMREYYRPDMPEKSEGESDAAFKSRMDEWREAAKLSNIVRDGSKKRSRYHHGVIAQEVKQTIDALGIDFGGFQDHAVTGGDDVMSIGYDEFIAPLIKAVQELAAEVERLKAQNP